VVPVQSDGVVLTANLTRSFLHQGKVPLAPVIASTLIRRFGFIRTQSQRIAVLGNLPGVNLEILEEGFEPTLEDF
jgi:hypothetical protein